MHHVQLHKSCERQTTAVSTTRVVYLGNFWIEDLKIMTTTIDTHNGHRVEQGSVVSMEEGVGMKSAD